MAVWPSPLPHTQGAAKQGGDARGVEAPCLHCEGRYQDQWDLGQSFQLCPEKALSLARMDTWEVAVMLMGQHGRCPCHEAEVSWPCRVICGLIKLTLKVAHKPSSKEQVSPRAVSSEEPRHLPNGLSLPMP